MDEVKYHRAGLSHLWANFRAWGASAATEPAERRLVVLRNVLMTVLGGLGVLWAGIWSVLGQWLVVAVAAVLLTAYGLFLVRLNRRAAMGSWAQWTHLLFVWLGVGMFADLMGPDSMLHLGVALAGTTSLLVAKQMNYYTWGLQMLLSLGLAAYLALYPHTFLGPLDLAPSVRMALNLGAQLTLVLIISLHFIAERQAQHWAAVRASRAQQVQQQQARLLDRLEHDRAEANRNLLALLDGSAAMLLLIDRQGRIVAFNDIFRRYAEEIDGNYPQVGDYLFGYESAFDTSDVRALFERALAGEKVRVYKSVFDRRGRPVTHDIHFEPVRAESGEVWAVVVTTIDVTEPELDRRRLERSESNLQALLDHSPDIIWSVDRNYLLLTINEGFNRYLESHGIRRLQVGECILDPFPDWVQEHWVGLYQRVFAGEAFTEELSAEWRGQMVYLELRLSPITGSEGTITGALVQMRVINERKAMEQQLIEAKEQAEQANAVKSRFLAHISHELRNPVHAILGFIDLLRRQPASGTETMLDLLARAARRLNDNLENLLDYNLLETGELRLQHLNFDLEQLLNDCAVLYVYAASQKGLAFETHIEALPQRWVVGDRVRLQRILDSLVDNALKFTQVGTIRLAATQIQLPEGQWLLQLTLSDTGEGMTPELIKHIYEPFVQADTSATKRVQGLGLGLAIVRQLVDLMGGRIAVQSTLGVGTTIELTLPFAPALEPDEELSTQAPLAAGSQRPLQILLAEDDEANAHYLIELLENLGWTVRWVTNGHQALRLLERDRFDVLILDGAMPVMDGIEVTEQIRQRQQANPDYPRIPIVVVTGYARGPERDRFLQLHVDAFLTKPVKAYDLVAAVLRAVGEPAF